MGEEGPSDATQRNQTNDKAENFGGFAGKKGAHVAIRVQ
jgi:hypothetical protein